ncbi:protein CBFA2T3 [Talpa occidentalis]|uniref:protein CBFA2T3 n=1 Tax=Talpa occidentalis TaxID=50954 RepID=UPI001890322E|nr:protein CBFA2T3 [Talpa occidentalis]
MPDSPAEVKTQPRATPPSMPPPAASQGPARQPPSRPTPHKHREDGPVMSLPPGRFHGCLKWSMVCLLMNGSSHSPTAVSGAPSTPSGFSNGPAASSTASLSTQHLPPACGARQLSKLKRFLSTLQQFGGDISPEIGERVRALVLGLVNSTLTIEEFHSKLQEATNFPLRPFVIPFLKANLPLLQRELLHCARLAKQTPAQYLAQHEQLLLDASASSPVDSSELLLDARENGKRRSPDRTKENGSDRDPLHPDHLSKRPCTLSPAQRYSPTHGPPHPTPPPHFRLEDMATAHHLRDAYRHADPRELRDRPRQLVVHGSRPEEVIDHRLTEREWAEEWKHLNNLLNCIMDMAEKTRRSLTVLRRCQEADREALNHWSRRCSDSEDPKKGPVPGIRPLGSSMGAEGAQLDAPRELLPRTLAGYMPEEIWRKAEEAVNEVKRQAMSELQKAVSDAERKAHELISTERAKMQRALAEARRQASEDALTVVNQQEDSSESCWNCGRKASETCSGCNAARYCGSFCQHKDWEKHHHVCGQSLQGPAAAAPGPPAAPCLPVGAASPCEAGSAGPSRPGSPGPPDKTQNRLQRHVLSHREPRGPRPGLTPLRPGGPAGAFPPAKSPAARRWRLPFPEGRREGRGFFLRGSSGPSPPRGLCHVLLFCRRNPAPGPSESRTAAILRRGSTALRAGGKPGRPSAAALRYLFSRPPARHGLRVLTLLQKKPSTVPQDSVAVHSTCAAAQLRCGATRGHPHALACPEPRPSEEEVQERGAARVLVGGRRSGHPACCEAPGQPRKQAPGARGGGRVRECECT